MIIPHTASSEVARMMSASVAPVFLITGIAAILSIMVLRYGRVVDRIRQLLRDGPKLYQMETGIDHLNRELRILYKRARLLRISIIIEVISICCIALTVFLMFASLSFGLNFAIVPQIMFILSLFLMVAGLGAFIHDFALSLLAIENDMFVRSDLNIAQESKKSIFEPLVRKLAKFR